MTDPHPSTPPAARAPSAEPGPDPAGAERAARRGSGPLEWVVAIVLAAVVGTLLFVGGWLSGGGGGGSATCAAPSEEFVSFCEAYERLAREHVDNPSDEALVEGAIRGMLQYGVDDPHSGYMAPEDYQRALGDLSGKFSGIGAEMSVRNLDDPADVGACSEFSDTCVLVVVAPLAGSPAEGAGLQAGDIVTAVDGESVRGTTMGDQISKIRGEEGTDVTLTVRRDDEGRTFDLTITRAEITIQEVSTRLIDGHVGYIELNGFSDSATQQFRAGLTDLLDQGADQIVFDLRDNPGGYIEAANRIASQFIRSGLTFTQESSGNNIRTWEATGDGVATDPDIPVVVLVNRGSASASEIVAAALQESGRATLVGEDTFGKNTVQIWSRLPNDAGVRITISRWFTPNHNSVAPDGISPDIVAARGPETPPDTDVVLDRALAFLAEGGVTGDRGAPAPAPAPAPSRSPSAMAPAPAGTVVGIVPTHRLC